MSIAIQNQATQRSAWSGALLVAGACIGGGMLAMPIQTAEAGFFLSSIAVFTAWIFMTFTGLLLVETTLWMKQNAHFSTLTSALLGPAGKFVSLVVYLFMNYASLVAYTAGGAALMNQWGSGLFGLDLGHAGGCIVFTLIFGSVVYLGATFIGRMNALFVMLMSLIYCALVLASVSHVNIANLAYRPAWKEGINSIPLIIAAFSYQMIVPSLCSYLNYNVRLLRKAIVLGTSVPFVVYFIWLWIIHGIVPFEGENGLHQAFIKGASATEPLKHCFQSVLLKIMSDGFAFFALVTSYLSLSLGLFDFIIDFFKGFKTHLSRNMTTFLSLFPSLVLAILFPRALLDFLDMSGGFGDAILSGMIPISMVWIGRYRKGLSGEYQAPGGKWPLIAAGAFALFIFLLQISKI